MGSTQLVGLEHEPGGLLGWLRRWDCDHYLAQAYRYTHFLRVFDICVPCSKLQWSRWSLAAYSPSTTVFLGDLVDEASEAAPDQMERWLLACHHFPSAMFRGFTASIIRLELEWSTCQVVIT